MQTYFVYKLKFFWRNGDALKAASRRRPKKRKNGSPGEAAFSIPFRQQLMSPQSTDFSAEKSSILASSAAGALRGHKHLSKRPSFVVMKRGVFFSTVGLPPRPPLRCRGLRPPPSCEAPRRPPPPAPPPFFAGTPRYF